MRKSAIATGLALALAAPFAMNQSRAAEQVMNGGKCWTNTSGTHFGWADCKKAASAKRGRPSANGPGRAFVPGGGPGAAGSPGTRDGDGGDRGSDRGGGKM
jgi:hypothetical protein